MPQQLPPEVLNLIDAALTEDQAFNDPTTQTLIPDDIIGSGILRAKADGVLAGGSVAAAVFRRIDPNLEIVLRLEDGAALVPGRDIASVRGAAASILRAERAALNFMQRMSGIATATSRYVAAVAGTPRPALWTPAKPPPAIAFWTNTASAWAAAGTTA